MTDSDRQELRVMAESFRLKGAAIQNRFAGDPGKAVAGAYENCAEALEELIGDKPADIPAETKA